MNKMKITFGIMSNKYQIEAYNKLDAYAAMAIFFKENILLVALFHPSDILKDNWTFNTEKLLSLFGGNLTEYLSKHHDEVKEAYLTIKKI